MLCALARINTVQTGKHMEERGERMKILLITDRMDTGGAETHIAMLARGLRVRGMQAAVLSSGGRAADRLEAEGIPQYRISPIGYSPVRFLSAKRLVRRLAEQEGYQILHAHARIPALLVRGSRSWKHAPASAVTVHAAFQRLPLLSGICWWGEQTVAVSEDLRAAVCDRFHVPAETVTVIPNGVDCNVFSPTDADAPPHSILFASRLDSDCALGAELLCSIAPALAARFPDLQITVAGGGNALPFVRKRAEEACAAFARSAGSRREPLIRTVGTVADMPALYRSHRVFVGVSRAALEAAACGCAVLLCGNEGYGGLLSPDTPRPALSNFCCRGYPLPTAHALLDDLSRLLQAPDGTAAVAMRARDWIVRNFDAQCMIERTVAFYRRLG